MPSPDQPMGRTLRGGVRPTHQTELCGPTRRSCQTGGTEGRQTEAMNPGRTQIWGFAEPIQLGYKSLCHATLLETIAALSFCSGPRLLVKEDQGVECDEILSSRPPFRSRRPIGWQAVSATSGS